MLRCDGRHAAAVLRDLAFLSVINGANLDLDRISWFKTPSRVPLGRLGLLREAVLLLVKTPRTAMRRVLAP